MKSVIVLVTLVSLFGCSKEKEVEEVLPPMSEVCYNLGYLLSADRKEEAEALRPTFMKIKDAAEKAGANMEELKTTCEAFTMKGAFKGMGESMKTMGKSLKEEG
ncbi:MAG: hypothetical protein ACRC6V_06640 [Bacteroidales bacterium]